MPKVIEADKYILGNTPLDQKVSKVMDYIERMYPQYFVDASNDLTVPRIENTEIISDDMKSEIALKKSKIWAPIGRVCRRGYNTKYPHKKPARSEALQIKQIAAGQYFDDLFGDNVVSMEDFVSSHADKPAKNKPPRLLTRREMMEVAFF